MGISLQLLLIRLMSKVVWIGVRNANNSFNAKDIELSSERLSVGVVFGGVLIK